MAENHFMLRFMRRVVAPLKVALPALVLWVSTGCDRSLEDAYDTYLDNTPAVCKDYCEEKAACGRPSSTGDYEKAEFASDVHMCEVACAAYGAEGAYVWYADPGGSYDRVLYDYLGGDEVMDVFNCLYGIGAFRCVIRAGEYDIEFSPPARNICESANECINGLGLEMTYSWATGSDGVGGSCQQYGGDVIDAMFF
ncbi:MAG: hypothetical protein JXX14_01145 [Deltaproteobacteria bacterium]|nr:hypothetical protein [Deltaproteobacteria bacterium]